MYKWVLGFCVPLVFLSFLSASSSPSVSPKASTQIICTWGRVLAAQDPDMLLIRVARDTAFLLDSLRKDSFLPVPATLLCRLDQKF